MIMKKHILSLAFALTLSVASFAQTLIIDYAERSKENTASIHLIESKLPIETEEFTDIEAAKTKLVRIIENYHSDGYVIRASNVSSHKHGRGYHYHYQYILQKDWLGRIQDRQEKSNTGRRMIGPDGVRPGVNDGSLEEAPGAQEQGKVQINNSQSTGVQQQQRQRILQDGSDKPNLMRQPRPVE